MTKIFRVASLGIGNKVAYNAAGDRFFVPAMFRDKIAVNDYVLSAEKSFSSRTKVLADGTIELDADNKPVIEPCDTWTRTDITFAGTKIDALSHMKEDELLALEGNALVEQKKVEIRKTYSLENVDLAELAG